MTGAAEWAAAPQRLTTPHQQQRIRELIEAGKPKLPGAQDVSAMNARQELLDLLMEVTGRDQRGHLMYGLYTGLFAEMPEA